MRRVLEDVANQLGKATLNEQHTAAEFLGKRVSRVQGPVQFLRAYKIIEKVTNAKKKQKVIRVGKETDTAYRICNTPAEREASVKKLKLLVAASPVIEGLVRKATQDLQGCRSILDVSFEILGMVRAPMLSKTGDDFRFGRAGEQ